MKSDGIDPEYLSLTISAGLKSKAITYRTLERSVRDLHAALKNARESGHDPKLVEEALFNLEVRYTNKRITMEQMLIKLDALGVKANP